MKIFNTAQMIALEKQTTILESINSLDLIEKTATAIKNWVDANLNPQLPYYIFCGTGDNGADGLALARILIKDGYEVEVYLIKFSTELSSDCASNEKRIWESGAEINYVNAKSDLPMLVGKGVIIDAIFGVGLNREVTGLAGETIEYINKKDLPIVSLDIPSGMLSDTISDDWPIIMSDVVLSYQFPKLCFFLPENEDYIDNWTILDIGLSYDSIDKITTKYNYLLNIETNMLLTDTPKFAHKGDNGHGLLIAGSKGMTGASILSARAAMRSGIGKLSIAVPDRNYAIVQMSVPEAMCLVQGEVYINRVPDNIENFDFVAIGPGLGLTKETEKLVADVLKKVQQPMVIDADALNTIAKNTKLFSKIPKFSILTPHIGEFERLVNKKFENSIERIDALQAFAIENQVVMVLKGAHSAIALPNGEIYFNSTGNPGMATAGTGDVLTGVLLALLAQGYHSIDAALLGVNLHGLAGDLAMEEQSTESLIASDVIENLGKAFRVLRNIGKEDELKEEDLEEL